MTVSLYQVVCGSRLTVQ